MDAETVVRGGVIVTPSGRIHADLVVSDGQLLPWAGRWSGRAKEVVDADGLLVFPGMIDTHVHLMDPGDTTRESFATGTAAAAAAGVTTIVEHTHSWPVTGVELLAEKQSHLRGKSYVDFGLAAHVFPGQVESLTPLWLSGISFFKIFTCTTHGVPGVHSDALLECLQVVSRLGAPVLVHCEDELVTARAERMLREANRMDPAVLNEWRTREAELLAVTQVACASWLTGARIRVAHASNPTVLSFVQRARASGASVSAETCPQYLLLGEDEVEVHGSLRKFTPPARNRNDRDRKKMWDAFNAGEVDHIASDHAPSTLAQKLASDFWSAPFGLPGLDTTFPILLDAALRGWTSGERVVDLYSARPARHLGLSRKGSLQAGADADFVLVDPTAEWTVTNERVRSRAAWSPYAGRELKGRVVSTYLRGRAVFDGGVVLDPPIGAFLDGAGARP